ncbi:MAG TPA: S8 family serine peptidase, partial [Vicinamibacterales bacterium]|nr:S8 family serine peptidase [Vicinamibacterales bacterium]
STTFAPFTASFSSRGPLLASADLLKPDLIAPGQDIVAAVAPPGNGGLTFNSYSGTSMSSPHVAGLAALLKDLYPDWSPMAIKSALMTTSGDIRDGANTDPMVIFRQGAGHVQADLASNPGVVFDSSAIDWFGFLCGTQLDPSFCTSRNIPVLDPSDFNVASIAIGELAGVQTVTRRLTNVGNSASTWTSSFTGMDGISVAVSPASVTIPPGESRPVQVTFTRTTAALNAYTGGQLTWTDGTRTVRIPMVVRPVALAVPAEVAGTGDPISYPVTFGYTGAFTATPRGLIPAVTTEGDVAQDPNQAFGDDMAGVVAIPVTIPAGTTYARFSLFDNLVTPPSDLDLYVYRGTTLVGSSGNAASNEQVSLLNPPAGDYTVYVHGWEVGGGAALAHFTLFHWLLDAADAGNMAVTAPAAATTGASGTITLDFTGLTPGVKYLGSVAYGGTAGLPNPTIVRIDR